MTGDVGSERLHRKKTGYIYNARHKREKGGQFEIMNESPVFTRMPEHLSKEDIL